MSRDSNPNLIALGISVVFLICFLFLPFYRIFSIGISAIQLMRFGAAAMYLPLVLAIVMGIACMVLDRRVSIVVGAVTLLATFVLLVVGRSILIDGNVLGSLANSSLTQATGITMTSILPVSAGEGSIICLLLAAGYVVAECMWTTSQRPRPSSDPFNESARRSRKRGGSSSVRRKLDDF